MEAFKKEVPLVTKQEMKDHKARSEEKRHARWNSGQGGFFVPIDCFFMIVGFSIVTEGTE